MTARLYRCERGISATSRNRCAIRGSIEKTFGGRCSKPAEFRPAHGRRPDPQICQRFYDSQAFAAKNRSATPDPKSGEAGLFSRSVLCLFRKLNKVPHSPLSPQNSSHTVLRAYRSGAGDLVLSMAASQAVGPAQGPFAPERALAVTRGLSRRVGGVRTFRPSSPLGHAALLFCAYVLAMAGIPRATAGERYHRARAATSDSTCYNFYLVATESFVNRIVARREAQVGPVCDCILGARVRGRHRTTTQVFVDLKPDDGRGRLDVRLYGLSCTDTVGTKTFVLTRSYGYNRIAAVKPLFFDGIRIEAHVPFAEVLPRIQTCGVCTPLSQIPILGSAVDQFASFDIERKRPLVECIVAQRLMDRVVPEFNANVDKQVATMNSQLSTAIPRRLEELRLRPDAQRVTTTETTILYGAHVPSPEKSRVGRPPATALSRNSLAVAVNQGLLNSALNRLEIGGTTMTEQQLDETVSRVETILNTWATPNAAGRQPTDRLGEKSPQPVPATIQLAERDPVEVHFIDGHARLIVRAGFKMAMGTEIPPHEITVPLHLTLEKDEIVITPGRISVAPVDGSSNNALGGLTQSIIRQRTETHLRTVRIGRQQLPPIGSSSEKLPLTIQEIVAEDGWLVLKLDCQ